MTPNPADLWISHLPQARWFQGKGLRLDGVQLTALDWYAGEGDMWVRSELAKVEAGGRTDTYHLLVGYTDPGTGEPEALIGRTYLEGRGEVDLVDAPRSHSAMREFLKAVVTGQSVSWHGSPLDPHAETRVFTGEQSNTTVQIGANVLMKILRKLDPGPNLEAQTMLALSDCEVTPVLMGVLSQEGYDLAIFSERIKDAREGWKLCVEACQAGEPVADEMTTLGQALRQLHACLAKAYPVSTTNTAKITAAMLVRLDTAAAEILELADLRPTLIKALSLPPGQVQIQRVHGDFHLGQALLGPSGWKIIDFEGEPAKPPQERATPDTVWRDVAGLTRSLDYARHHQEDPDSGQARRWYEQARQAFLEGYGKDSDEKMLRAYEVDKAIYEWQYELRNRPTWAAIPRAAITSSIVILPLTHGHPAEEGRI